MDAIREFLNKPVGKIIGAAIGIAALMASGWIMYRYLGPTDAERASRDRVYIDSETGKTFTHSLQIGDTIPLVSPSTGRPTGYPAEMCYWTPDGHLKDDPTPVLLNQYVGKKGPTFCPDCGRLVVPHNPKPNPQDKPPPTLAEYNARHPKDLAQGRTP